MTLSKARNALTVAALATFALSHPKPAISDGCSFYVDTSQCSYVGGGGPYSDCALCSGVGFNCCTSCGDGLDFLFCPSEGVFWDPDSGSVSTNCCLYA